MRNKHKWRSILLIGLVLLLASSVVGCDGSPPVINDFSANPAQISAGESATLLWNVTKATSVNIDQGIGNVPASGTKEVSPTKTIAYTLTATNSAGPVTKAVVITVKPPDGNDKGKKLPSGAISWDKAKNHIGERTTVCGPVVSATWASGSKGKPTFLNIGKPYPDPDRFTVIIWEQYRSNFPQPPEAYYRGKTICVTGLIIPYKGIPEIEVKTPEQIKDP
jgi:micrococcal nuclease